MKEKALTYFIFASALSTTLTQISGGYWISQVVVIACLVISSIVLVIGQNITRNYWLRILHIVDSIELRMTAVGFGLASTGLDFIDSQYVLIGAIFLIIGAPLFGIGFADNIMHIRQRVSTGQSRSDQERQLTSQNRFDQESATRFLITEYEQSFSHMRHYDNVVMSLIRYLFMFFAAVFTASIALYQYLAGAPYQNMVIGIISLFSFMVGMIFLILILRNRLYYTIVARQVNSIRNYFLNNMELDYSQYNVSYTNPDEPRALNIFSSYTLLYFIAGLINGALAGASYLFLYTHFKGVTIEDIWLVGLLIFVGVVIIEVLILTSHLFVRR